MSIYNNISSSSSSYASLLYIVIICVICQNVNAQICNSNDPESGGLFIPAFTTGGSKATLGNGVEVDACTRNATDPAERFENGCIPADNDPQWTAIVYVIVLFWLFLGVSVFADVFMGAIEAITSKSKIVEVHTEHGVEQLEVKTWNATVANLTLMALGSSAPEILLSVIEIFGNDFYAGELGPSTIVGSAAYNLLIITAITVASIPAANIATGETGFRKIRDTGVHFVTSVFSVFAYVWLVFILMVWTPDVVTIEEGIITFLLFPVLVMLSFGADKGYFTRRGEEREIVDQELVVGARRRSDNEGAYMGDKPARGNRDEGFILRARHAARLLKQMVPRGQVKHVGSDLGAQLLHAHVEKQEPVSRATRRRQAIKGMIGAKRVKLPEDRIADFQVEMKKHYEENVKTVRKFTVEFSQSSYQTSESLKKVELFVRRTCFEDDMATPTDTVYVDYRTVGGTATADEDYISTAGTLEFTPDKNECSITIVIVDDDVDEDMEEFYVVLENLRLTLDKDAGMIDDDDDDSKHTTSSTTTTPKHHRNLSHSSRAVRRPPKSQLDTYDAIGADDSLPTETNTHKHRKHKHRIRPSKGKKKSPSHSKKKHHKRELPTEVRTTFDHTKLGITTATVSIIDDDDPGEISMATTALHGHEAQYETSEAIGHVVINVVRKKGARGRVSVRYRTVDGTAIGGQDFDHVDDELVFESGEVSKTIRIRIIDDDEYEKAEHFKVQLYDPKGCKIGGVHTAFVTIQSDDEMKNLADRVVALFNLNRGKYRLNVKTWHHQFEDALYWPSIADGHTKFDVVMHIIALPWKILGACVPPTSIAGAYPTFFGALIAVGICTALISDFAELFGCSVGLKNSVTAITFVALGTSLPDTFASKTAAINDSTADSSVGNVTGSNSVNVFLGLGLPWSLAAIYWKINGSNAVWKAKVGTDIANEYPDGAFVVPAGDLGFSVVVFCICAVIALLTLLYRRIRHGAELGGPSALIAGVCLSSLWFIYIVLSSLKAYGDI